jgi:lipoate---protein ligase
MIQVVEEGIGAAFTHMERDRKMLAQGKESPCLSFYDWDTFCVTYGLFAQPEKVLNIDSCKLHGIQVVSRPTGGGIFFHKADFPFSLYLPQGVFSSTDSFEGFWTKIQQGVVSQLCSSLTDHERKSSATISGRFCQLEAQGCDFVWQAKKFGGAAFRKTKRGILCQATLFCHALPWEKIQLCVKDQRVLDVMSQVSLSINRKDLKEVITKAIKENL